MPAFVRALSRPLLERAYPVQFDQHPPTQAGPLARWLAQHNLLCGESESEARRYLAQQPATVEHSAQSTPPPARGKIRVPAQWEAAEQVLITWPVLYPPLWALHAQMVEGLTPVCTVSILVPAPLWAQAAHLFLRARAKADLSRLRFILLPTDDIWVRDYGPVVGHDEEGETAAVYGLYLTLPNYPQQRDRAAAARWAAHEELPARALNLRTEGGNLWSDGQGTLIMSQQVFHSNPHLSRGEIEERLHEVFIFDKLILLPRLKREETGHIDLLVKLADARTALMTAPTLFYNGSVLRKARWQLEHETNARGERYHVLELPALPPYLNWLGFPIWRSYTNALTINGRVLVPVYGVAQDTAALETYQRAMPGYTVIGIDCKAGVNGGGAVHCLTKEVPQSQKRL